MYPPQGCGESPSRTAIEESAHHGFGEGVVLDTKSLCHQEAAQPLFVLSRDHARRGRRGKVCRAVQVGRTTLSRKA